LAGKLYNKAIRVAGKMSEPLRTKSEAEVEVEWAGVLYRQGEMQEAAEMFGRGFGKLVSDCWRSRLIAGQGYLFWGDLCTDEGRYREAEQHYREAFHLYQAMGNDAGTILALQRIGDALVLQGRRHEAEDTIQRAVALESRVLEQQRIREGKLPSGNPITVMSLPDLYFCRGDYAQARRLYREKVAFWERQADRPDVIDVGQLQLRLAIAESRSGHEAEAMEMFNRAESTFAREWGGSHPKVMAARQAQMPLKSLVAAG
jgi:tetratricopeptide (TPR) repeat protein